MSNPNPFTALLQSRRFWLAVLALVQTALFLFKPDFPPELWDAISNVLLVLIISVTVENVGTYIAAGLAPTDRFVQARVLPLSEPGRLPWLLRSRKFWLAVVAVVQSAIFSAYPGFPVELWTAINSLLMVLIGLFATEDLVRSISSAVAARQVS